MRKNILEADRPQMEIWCMRIACWITKATNTDSECVILILFQSQQCILSVLLGNTRRSIL